MRYWAHLTTTDFAAIAEQNAIAILPVAAIEQHGPHLPLGTDAHIAEGFLADMGEALQDLGATAPHVLCLPMQTIGHSPEHTHFAGTLSAKAETLMDAWVDIGACVARAGIKKLLIINSHGGNSALLDIVVRRLRMEHNLLATATHWLKLVDLSDIVSADERAYGVHGGLVETSLMLSIAPQLVRMDQAQHFSSSQQTATENYTHLRHYGSVITGWTTEDLNPQGVMGDAVSATTELGLSIRQRVQKNTIELLYDLQKAEHLTLS